MCVISASRPKTPAPPSPRSSHSGAGFCSSRCRIASPTLVKRKKKLGTLRASRVLRYGTPQSCAGAAGQGSSWAFRVRLWASAGASVNASRRGTTAPLELGTSRLRRRSFSVADVNEAPFRTNGKKLLKFVTGAGSVAPSWPAQRGCPQDEMSAARGAHDHPRGIARPPRRATTSV